MYYRQPRYFGDFHCIGSDCRNDCCHGWRIDWKEEEVEKLKSSPDCSGEMRELIDKSFAPIPDNPEQRVIIFNINGKCPFMTSEGLCKIQKELGAEYLSHTCTVYPRHYILADEIMYRFCSMSCYEIMNKILNDEKSMDLVNVPVKVRCSVKGVEKNSPEALAKHPELKYRGELLEFFYEIIADKKRSVEDSMILGALAAEKLSQYVEDRNYDLIPDALTAFKKQLRNPEQLKKIAEIKPNYNIKLGVLAEALKPISSLNTLVGVTDKTGKLNIDYYLQGEKRLDEAYKDRPFYLRNIALNLLLELSLPFKFYENSIFENYSIFAAAFGMFKLNAVATSELVQRKEANTRVSVRGYNGLRVSIKLDADRYIHKSCALVSRSLCHNSGNAKKVLELLREKKMTSPAYLALMIK